MPTDGLTPFTLEVRSKSRSTKIGTFERYQLENHFRKIGASTASLSRKRNVTVLYQLMQLGLINNPFSIAVLTARDELINSLYANCSPTNPHLIEFIFKKHGKTYDDHLNYLSLEHNELLLPFRRLMIICEACYHRPKVNLAVAEFAIQYQYLRQKIHRKETYHTTKKEGNWQSEHCKAIEMAINHLWIAFNKDSFDTKKLELGLNKILETLKAATKAASAKRCCTLFYLSSSSYGLFSKSKKQLELIQKYVPVVSTYGLIR